MIPKTWDLRHALTTYQKRVVRERSKRYEAVIAQPEKFFSRKYSKKTRTKLKAAGYFGEGDRVLIPNFGDKTMRVTVNTDYITVHRTLRSRGDTRRGETVTEHIYLHSGPKLIAELQKKFKHDLPRGEYWALKVGDNNTFLSNHSKNLYQLMHYAADLADDWSSGGEDEDENPKAWAKKRVHLVRFRFDNGKDYEQLKYDTNNPADPSRFKKWGNKRGK